MANLIQVKRGALASIPTLAAGEFGFSNDVGEEKLHIGNGSSNKEVLMHNSYNAQSFLFATLNNTPENKTPAEVMSILSGQMSADFDLNNYNIVNLADPLLAQDAATKGYVDALVQGLKIHQAVIAATTGNITLSGLSTAVDGITLTAGNRVLVRTQTNPEENGIYVAAVGAWSRAADQDSSLEVAGSFVYVSSGSTLSSTGWACTVDPDGYTLGTDPMPWAQFSSAGYVTASGGLTKTGNNISLTSGGVLEEINSIGASTAADQIIVSTAAGVSTWESGSTARESLGLAIGTDVLAQQTIGIADNNLVEVDGTPIDNEYAKWTANGLEGRTFAEVMADLSGSAIAAFDLNAQLLSNILDPVSAQDAATKAWVEANFGGTNGATQALDNLVNVALNTALLPDAPAADDFGSATLPFKDLYFAGSSATPGTNNFQLTGTSTSGTRVATLPDSNGTLLNDFSIIDGGVFA